MGGGGGAGAEISDAGGGGSGSGSGKEATVRESAAEMGSFLAFAEAFAGAAVAASSRRSLPGVVVVTRGVHACVESDTVREGV